MDMYLRCKIPTLSFHIAAPFAGKSSLKLCIANTDEMKKLQFKVQQQKDLPISTYYEKRNMTNSTWEQKGFTIHINEHGNQTKTLVSQKTHPTGSVQKGNPLEIHRTAILSTEGNATDFTYSSYTHIHTYNLETEKGSTREASLHWPINQNHACILQKNQ